MAGEALQGRFPYETLSKYPHMQPEDVMVWHKYIQSHPDVFERCDYDVAVGEGAPTDPSHTEVMQGMHTILTQKKIDVVAYKGYKTFLIEVKPVANARGLGQILTYLKLYKKDHLLEQNIIPMIVCGSIEREMEEVFDLHGIRVEVA